ncbi:MAG: hypothetical protein RR389_01085 [Christensenella sp.]
MEMSIGGINVSRLVNEVSISGNTSACTRTLSAEILQSVTDAYIPIVNISKGQTTIFREGDLTHYGVIFRVSRSTNANTVTLQAYDLGIYIKKNQITRKVSGESPENVAKSICEKLGFVDGYYEPTNFKFYRKFFGVTAYDAIMTGYTFASEKTNDKYIMRVRNTRINVERKGAYIAAIIRPKANLIYATYSESIENAVNRVEVRSDGGSLLYALEGDTSYGTICHIIKDGDDARKNARNMIKDGEAERSATVQILGNLNCLTGDAVIIKEPYTGIYGLFFIEEDVHMWKKGIYTTKLTLAYKNIMDEKEVGEKISQNRGGAGGSENSNGAANDGDLTFTDPDGNTYVW